MDDKSQNSITLRFAEQGDFPSSKVEASFFLKQRNPFGRLGAKQKTFDEYMAFKDTIFETISQLEKYPNVSSNYIHCLALYQLGNDKIIFTPEQTTDWQAFCRKVPEVLASVLDNNPAAQEYLGLMQKAPIESYVFRDSKEKAQLQAALKDYNSPVVFLEKDVRNADDWAILNRAMLMTLSLNPAIQFDTSKVSLTLELNNSLQAENQRVRALYHSFIEEAAESQLYPGIARDIGLISQIPPQKNERCSPISLESDSSMTQLEEWVREIPDLAQSTVDLNDNLSLNVVNNNMRAEVTVNLPKDQSIQKGLFSDSHASKVTSEKIVLAPQAIPNESPRESLSSASRVEKRKGAAEQKKAMDNLSRPKTRAGLESNTASGLFFQKQKSPIQKSKLEQSASMQRLSTPRAPQNSLSDKENNKGARNTLRPKMRS